MGLFDFLKSKKKKGETVPENEGGELLELGEDPAGIDPPETRYTQEYQDFLASREADERSAAPAGEACADAGVPAEEPAEEESAGMEE